MSSDDDVSSGDLSSDDGRSNGFEEEEEEEEEGEEGKEGFVVDDAWSLVTFDDENIQREPYSPTARCPHSA